MAKKVKEKTVGQLLAIKADNGASNVDDDARDILYNSLYNHTLNGAYAVMDAMVVMLDELN